MTGVFIVGRHLSRFDIVDSAWGPAFIVVSVTSLLVSDTAHPIQYLITGMVAVWGLRLSGHIYRRFRASAAEDKRYVEMRKKWKSGNENVAIFFRIYLTQAILATIICLPVIIINVSNMATVSPVAIIGLAIWIIGFTVEALADRQLRDFVRNPQNKGYLMTRGLWRYSRHPNYFGELTLWWGVGIMALAVPYGWIGLVGPALISYLLIFVSGISPTEKAFAGRLGWDDYKNQTSVLFPWFPGKGDKS
ncbi:MAG: hypothetical protein JWM07_342 [Candidatus Saccharibacteria bacterium]|nr:hypothetical protein [Candidatus Saccharibacteria bacterium]